MVGRESGRLMCQGSQVLTPLPAKLFFSIFILRIYSVNLQKRKCTFLGKKKEWKFYTKKYRGFPCRILGGYPCKICGDIPVNSKQITCKWCIFFKAISTCTPEVRNYGDFRQHVIPTIITCMLRGTPCYTGFSYTFNGENICSVVITNICLSLQSRASIWR